jgi:tetratricopeptide (TPR) repeat protein
VAGRLLAVTALLIVLPGCILNSSVVPRERGERAQAAGDWPQARSDYAEAVDRDPTDVQALYRLGVAELELDRPTRAVTHLEQAYVLRDRDARWTPRILDALSRAYLAADRPDAGATMLANIAEQEGTSAAYLRQGRFAMEVGDMDAARVALGKASRFADPRDPEPWIALADFYLRINNQESAVTALRHATWAEPDNPDVARRLRQLGYVPGPALALPPPQTAQAVPPMVPVEPVE